MLIYVNAFLSYYIIKFKREHISSCSGDGFLVALI